MKDSIAIVGVSFDLPNIKNWSDLKASLSDSASYTGDMPAHRLKEIQEAFGISEMAKAGYLAEIDKFDNEYFDFTERESLKMFPEQRLFLTNAMKAFYHAGYNETDLKASKTGVFYTSPKSAYSNYGGISNVSFGAFDFVKGIEATMLAKYLDLRGPVMAINTSCSSSLTAINNAKHSLNADECDIAIVGAVKTLALTEEAAINNVVHSKKGMCRPFDKDADGMMNGEGAIFFVLKRYEKALEDGDTILGEIKGIGINHGGSRISSLTAPSSEAQKEVILQAWEKAEIDINNIGYIEAHGTGTILGDPIEVEGIRQAFFSKKEVYKKQPLALSSFKGQIGHLDYLSGLAGLLRLVAALNYKIIPAQANFNTLNSHFNMEGTAMYIPKEAKAWEIYGNERIGGLSSFGMTGTNVHLVVSQTENRNVQSKIEKDVHYVQISQKTPEKLKQYKQYLHHNISKLSTLEEVQKLCQRLNKTFMIDAENQGIIYDSKESLLTSLQKEKTLVNTNSLVLLLDLELLSYSKEEVTALFAENSFLQESWNMHVDVSFKNIDNPRVFNILTQYTIYKYLFEKFGNNIKLITPQEDSIVNKLLKSKVSVSDIIETEIANGETHSEFQESKFIKYMQANFTAKNVCIIDFSTKNKKRFNDLGLKITTYHGAFADKDRYEIYRSLLETSVNPLRPSFNADANTIELPFFQLKRFWPELKTKLSVEATETSKTAQKSTHSQIEVATIKREITEIWEDILETTDFTDTDDFFELGGTSLSGLDMIDEVEMIYNTVKIEYEDLFKFATVSKLTEVVATQLNVQETKPEVTKKLTVVEVSKTVREIWTSILETTDFTDTDDFFELGGTSLIGLDMIDEVETTYENVKIEYEDLFKFSTVAKLAETILTQVQGNSKIEVKEDHEEVSIVTAQTEKKTTEVRVQEYKTLLQNIEKAEFSKEIPEKILITGGTGLVGMAMVNYLLHNTNANLDCIVRKKDFDTAKARFWSIFEKYHTITENDKARIHVIEGDLNKKGIVVSGENTDFSKIDMIFHIAGTPQFMSQTSKYGHINYVGTKNLVNWANTHKIKKLSFVSTIGVVGETMPDEIENFYETDGNIGQQSTKLIHGASKLLAEEYIRNNYNHESKIFRITNVGGSYKTGIFPTNIAKNLMWLRLKSLADFGYYSKEILDESSGVSYFPCDTLSTLIAEISFSNVSLLHTYHIKRERSFNNREILTALQKAGVDLKEISYNEFITYLGRNKHKMNFHQVANKEKKYTYHNEATNQIISKLNLDKVMDIDTQLYLEKLIYINLKVNNNNIS